MRRRATVAVLTVIMVMTGAMAAPASGGRGGWSPAEDIESFGRGAHPNFNTENTEGCPFISSDGKRLFIASNRPGGLGGLDIWVSTRSSKKQAWSEPVNVGAPINSAANDFCPTIASDGKTFFFVSTRDGHCGDTANADIYTAKLDKKSHAKSVKHLGCKVNSAWDEHSPFPAKVPGQGHALYYSSARPSSASDAAGDHDIYSSPLKRGKYVEGKLVSGINTTANEGQPNVRSNGKELFFWSDRPGGQGAADIYSTKMTKRNRWGTPENLGPKVNSAAAETRPSLSSDGKTLYFGSTRNAGQSDIFVTQR